MPKGVIYTIVLNLLSSIRRQNKYEPFSLISLYENVQCIKLHLDDRVQ